MSPSRYVEWVLEKAEEEAERVRTCLDVSLEAPIRRVVRTEAGAKMGSRIIRRGEL